MKKVLGKVLGIGLIAAALIAGIVYAIKTPVEFIDRGDISNIQREFDLLISDEVEEVKLIDTVHVSKKSISNEISIDGTIFWRGRTKEIPEHEVSYFRGFSPKLDSYVFLRYNYECSGSFEILDNYDTEEEEAEAEILLNRLQEVFATAGIKIQTLSYMKYSQEDEDLDSLYKLPKDFYDNYPSDKDSIFSRNQLLISVSIDKDLSAIRELGDELFNIFEEVGYGISIEIVSNDGYGITIFKGSSKNYFW